MSWCQYKRSQDAYNVPLPPGPLQVPPSQTATLPYKFSVDPAVWGPGFWYTLHNRARVYSDNPSDCVRRQMTLFIESIPIAVPCSVCEQDARGYITKRAQTDGLRDVVKNRTSLVQFFIEFHNYVNHKTGKPSVDSVKVSDMLLSDEGQFIYPLPLLP